jgi:signal peptidase I
MGDNRDDSADSRSHDCQIPGAKCEPWDRDGTIPENKVIGRAFLVIWPLSRFKVLWVPATFSQAGLSARQPRATPSDSALPLAAGGIIAVPLTLLERRWRLRAGTYLL